MIWRVRGVPCKSARRWRLFGKLQSQSESCLQELFHVKLPRALSRAELEQAPLRCKGTSQGCLKGCSLFTPPRRKPW